MKKLWDRSTFFSEVQLQKKEGGSASVKLFSERVNTRRLERRAKDSGMGPCKLFSSSWRKIRCLRLGKFSRNDSGKMVVIEL